jgi:hypothetical protein
MERRKHSRFACGGDARLSPIGAEPSTEWKAAVHDLSRQGISLASERRFEPHSLLLVRWQPEGEADAQFLVSRVARVTPQRNHRWLLGCVFLRKLTLDELAVLMLAMRTHKRFTVRATPPIVRKGTDQERAAQKGQIKRVIAALRGRDLMEKHDS